MKIRKTALLLGALCVLALCAFFATETPFWRVLLMCAIVFRFVQILLTKKGKAREESKCLREEQQKNKD